MNSWKLSLGTNLWNDCHETKCFWIFFALEITSGIGLVGNYNATIPDPEHEVFGSQHLENKQLKSVESFCKIFFDVCNSLYDETAIFIPGPLTDW